MTDNVNRPNHYIAGDYECIKVAKAIVEESDMSAWRACLWFSAFQYVWRAFRKNGAEDIDKAILYLKWLKEDL